MFIACKLYTLSYILYIVHERRCGRCRLRGRRTDEITVRKHRKPLPRLLPTPPLHIACIPFTFAALYDIIRYQYEGRYGLNSLVSISWQVTHLWFARVCLCPHGYSKSYFSRRLIFNTDYMHTQQIYSYILQQIYSIDKYYNKILKIFC